MIRVDEDLLRRLGLDALSPADKKLMLRHIYETLEFRVGTKLASRLDSDQIEKFEALIQAGDEQASLAFLQQVAPDYKDIVAASFEALCEEIEANAEKILAASH